MVEFILSCVGLTFIIVLSYLFKNIRKFIQNKSLFFGKLINCTMCTGFYVGILIKTILIYYYNSKIIYKDIFIIILYGFISSYVSYVSYLLLKYFIDKYDN